MSWSHEQVNILIEEYRKHPCLYAVKSKMYTNKHARQEALQEILVALQPVKSTVTINEIKAKYQGLKATFMNEYKKYIRSLHSGMGDDEIYTSPLWYYEKFKFILDHIEVRGSFDSLAETNTDSNSENMEEYFINIEGTLTPTSPEVQEIRNLNAEQSTSSTSVYHDSCTPKRLKKNDCITDIEHEASNALKTLNKVLTDKSQNTIQKNSQDDVAFATFIISKLKQINKDNIRLEVEENITSLLYSGIKKCNTQ